MADAALSSESSRVPLVAQPKRAPAICQNAGNVGDERAAQVHALNQSKKKKKKDKDRDSNASTNKTKGMQRAIGRTN